MTQKIKLMSDEERVIFTSEITLNKTYRGFRDMEALAYKISTKLLDECEKRAFEKEKEACKWFYMNITQTATSLRYLSDSANKHFELMFQQYLKEQDGKE